MMIFLNGPFGVGKTTVARRLVARLPQGTFYDPEVFGFVLKRVIPPGLCPADYQDLALWRNLTVAFAPIRRAIGGRTLVIPMTIWRPEVFAAVVGGLRAREPDFHHFTLTATAATLEARIRRSAEAVDWRLAHLERGLAALAADIFATHIATDGRTPHAIAATIAALLPARGGVRSGEDVAS